MEGAFFFASRASAMGVTASLIWSPGPGSHVARFAQHFVQRGDSGTHLRQSVLTKQQHAVRDGLIPDVGVGCVIGDQAPLVARDRHDFVEADAPAVAGIVTRRAAFPLEVDRVQIVARKAGLGQDFARILSWPLALVADPAHEPLRDDRVQRAGHQERLEPHVHHAVDRRRRIVGMDGG